MATFNTLHATMICPRCDSTAEMEIEMRFGDTRRMDNYSIGDRYRWIAEKSVQNGGRPENGDVNGEGYTECPLCKLDFFVKVLIRQDVIQGVEPDSEKAPYIPLRLDRTVVKEFFSPDSAYRVIILRRSDGLYEIESQGHRAALDGVPLTDTLENAEKLARESLRALTGLEEEHAVGQVVTHADVIPPKPPQSASADIEAFNPPIKNQLPKARKMKTTGAITYNPNWELTQKRQTALLRLAELGVNVYSSVSSDNFRLLVPFDLSADVYVEIGYLMAQLGDEDFPHGFHHPIATEVGSKLFDWKMGRASPVSANDSIPDGYRYTVTPKKELKG